MELETKLNYDNLIIESSIKYYGGRQEWYRRYWQRMAGCGPTTASTITMYEKRKNNLTGEYNKSDFIKLMEELWEYITPGAMGLNKVEYYAEGFDRYISHNNILPIMYNINKRQ